MFKRILYFIVFPIVVLIVLFHFTASGLCQTDYSSDKFFSPDGEYFVQIHDSNCGGATGENTTGVTISNAKSIFSNYDFLESDIINAQTGNERGIWGALGSGTSIKTSWVDNRTLKITLSECVKELGRSNSWRDIKIVYEEKCSDNNVPLVSPSPTN